MRVGKGENILRPFLRLFLLRTMSVLAISTISSILDDIVRN